MKNSRFNHIFAIAVVLMLTAYQLVRVIAFVDVYGGIEHDGGWFLSVARSLAEDGRYVSMVSTLESPSVVGGIGVDQRFDIQAPDGRIWFFTGAGTGPAGIIPNAIVMRVFGFGFWALHFGPLLFYALFLVLTAYALYHLSGLWAVVLFHCFLFFYPRLTVFLSYEAMGEMTTLFFIVGSYVAFALAAQTQQGRGRWFLLAGLIAGLAVNVKMIALLSICGIALWAAILRLGSQVHRATERHRVSFREMLVWATGLVVLQLVWELIQAVVLVRLAGFSMYLQHLEQRIQFVLDDGSGIGAKIHSGAEFAWRKFFILAEVGHPDRTITALIFVGVLIGGLSLWRLWHNQRRKCDLVMPIWLGWLANTAWFVSLAKTGWPRHFWFGLMLAVVLLSILPVAMIETGMGKIKRRNDSLTGQSRISLRGMAKCLMGAVLLVLIVWGWVSQPHVWSFLLSDKLVSYWHATRFSYYDGAGLPWIVIPRSVQSEVVDYINRMPPDANVYYPAAHKAAEIPPQTGRVHYPINRRAMPGVVRHPADIVLVSPSIISPWKDPGIRLALLDAVERACPSPVLRNDYYLICLADDVRLSE